jgi:hypothetical protein
LGLKWTDLDWIKLTIRVECQLVRPDGNGFQFSTPKTEFGKRSIKLGEKTNEVICKHDERQQEERMSAGVEWEDFVMIFTTRNGTPSST